MLFQTPPALPPAEIRQADQALSLVEAESQVLQTYDLRTGNGKLSMPEVKPKDRPRLQWLLSAADEEIPANPFRKGTRQHLEAEALRALHTLPATQRLPRIKQISLTMSGSFMALWNWGKNLSRQGSMDKTLRLAWEDRLLTKEAPDVMRGYALRHALCFVLAENDEARFAAIKARDSKAVPELFQSFQRAFSMLGGPGPKLRFWRVPEMEPVDISISELGFKAFWVMQYGDELPVLPPGTGWIIPTQQGILSDKDTYLRGPSLQEAATISEKLKREGRSALLAPSYTAMEPYALVFFPILIRLDEQGMVKAILMGDAAPAKP